ncbi:hypothetical protein JOS77_11840 [Chromobacterium haemolyticum]|nr:hypothetical protein JOS77_11840 [Chromobacterium haemolyticum]
MHGVVFRMPAQRGHPAAVDSGLLKIGMGNDDQGFHGASCKMGTAMLSMDQVVDKYALFCFISTKR